MDFLSNLLPAVPSFELDPTSPYQNITFLQNSFIVTFIASLALTTFRNILEPRQERFCLENDPECGLLTGGREECWWGCDIYRHENALGQGNWFTYFTDPSCLDDCYPADHCFSLLLDDYKAAGGICRGSWLDVTAPGLFPVSNKTCELLNESEDIWQGSHLKSGLCSERTKQLLTTDQQNCIRPLWGEKFSIFFTTDVLILSLCDIETWKAWRVRPIKRSRNKKKNKRKMRNRNRKGMNKIRKSKTDDRLTPIDWIEIKWREN